MIPTVRPVLSNQPFTASAHDWCVGLWQRFLVSIHPRPMLRDCNMHRWGPLQKWEWCSMFHAEDAWTWARNINHEFKRASRNKNDQECYFFASTQVPSSTCNVYLVPPQPVRVTWPTNLQNLRVEIPLQSKPHLTLHIGRNVREHWGTPDTSSGSAGWKRHWGEW